MDVWVSTDGADWTQVSDAPWNAAGPEDIKYDFDALVAAGGGVGGSPAIFTFGGDRETFDFADPENYLRVDDDVWRFVSEVNARLAPIASAMAADERTSARDALVDALAEYRTADGSFVLPARMWGMVVR